VRLLALLLVVAGMGFGQIQQEALDRAVEGLVKRNALTEGRPDGRAPQAAGVAERCSIRLREVGPLAEPAPMPEMKVQRKSVPMPIAVVPAPPCER